MLIGRFEQWAYDALQPTKKDSLWQTQMAMIYAKCKLTREALERSGLVLEMDPNNWRASVCRARLAPPKEAIQILQTVISRRKADIYWMQDPAHMQDLADLDWELAEEHWRDEQFNLAVPIYTASLKKAPQHLNRFMKLFRSYCSKGRLTEIVCLIDEISKIESGKHLAELVMSTKHEIFLKEFDGYISFAVVQTKNFSILERLYEPAIRKGEKMGDHEMLGHVRRLYARGLSFDCNRREDKVIELWEQCLSNYPKHSDTDFDLGYLNSVISKLAPLYLQRALAAKANSDLNTATNYLSKLSEMLPEVVTPSEIDLPPQLWLARYHHLNGDDAKARQVVRNSVQVVIELLSDEDESNDMDAFHKARFIFTALGDEINALTSIAMETREERSRYGKNGPYMSLLCDAKCGKFADHRIGMWICKHCVNMLLDDECMADLKVGKLKRNVCNPNHDFIRVPKWEGDWLDSVPKGMVPWGDQIITLDKWKQKIRLLYIDSNA